MLPSSGRLAFVFAVALSATVWVGCASNNNSADSGDADGGSMQDAPDAAQDAGIDATTDAAIDAAMDVARDVSVDATPEASTDAPTDAATDAAIDARPDAPTDVATDTPTTDGGGPRVTITGFFASGNCMPIVPADPIGASWTLNISGSRGTMATVVAATLTVRGGSTVTQMLTVTPASVTLSGGAGSAMQRKLTGTPTPTAACSTLCSSGSEATLDLTVDDGTGRYPATASAGYLCAF